MRILGIVGLAHCGSTALSRLMACIPEVASAGEVHWLIDWPRDDRKNGLCAAHGKDCEVYTPAFCSQRFAARSLYSRVLKQEGKDVLLSSDKSLRNYARFVGPQKMTAIILYRRPLAQAVSTRKASGMSIEKCAGLWKSYYCKALGWAELYAKDYVVVSLERFMATPRISLNKLGERLELNVPKKIPRLCDISYHHIRGNRRAHSSKGLFVDRKWRRIISPEAIKNMNRKKEVSAILNGLDNMARKWSK